VNITCFGGTGQRFPWEVDSSNSRSSMQVISFLSTRKTLVPRFVFFVPITLDNFQVLEMNNCNRDLLFILSYQRIGNKSCYWGFVWSKHF